MSEETVSVYIYKIPYRRCIKADGFSYPIAVCETCKRAIEPSRKESSKTGAHGVWHYVHEHPLAFIVLEESNSGKRRARAGLSLPRPLREMVVDAWEHRGLSAEEVEEAVARWLTEKWKGERDVGGETS